MYLQFHVSSDVLISIERWWELSSDHPVNHTDSLVRVVVDGMGGMNQRHMQKVDNVLDYPQSCYDNIRSGMS